MDLLRCYTNDDDKKLPEKKQIASPQQVFGISRRTVFNLETTTKRAIKLPGKNKSVLSAFDNREPDFI